MSGRFPEANNLDEFWANLISGKESIREFPEIRRQELETILGPLKKDFAKFGYLDDVTLFEPEIFSISKEESKIMDPQHRLLLELTEEAILDAGYNPKSLANQYVGVFVAERQNDYTIYGDRFSPMVYVNSLSATNAGRISYTYNFHGPALTIGTACSSSMVALHYACLSLKTGESDYAITGSAKLLLFSMNQEEVEKFSIYSNDQKVRTFDQNANGTIAGEGGGIVFLKLLKNALLDGDHIHAIIKGSAVNSDGKWSNGITAPSEVGQADVIRRALKNADIDPMSISYLETHGTGTPLGDPIEAAGVCRVFKELNYPYQSVPIGALKTNIGHLDSAAGVAGIIKTVLAFKYKKIPPSINFQSPNSIIDFINSPVYVNSKLTDWESPTVRRAGVTSLGLTGTNSHLILEEWIQEVQPTVNRENIITLSAQTEKSLNLMIKNLKKALQKQSHLSLDDIAYTLNVGRRNLVYKFATLASSTEDLVEKLTKYLKNADSQRERKACSIIRQNPHDVINPVFIFPDIEDISVFDSHELLQKELTFKKYYSECAREFSVESDIKNHYLRYLQHIYAYTKLLASYSVEPKVVVGFGVGDLIADLIRGRLTLRDAIKKVRKYSQSKVNLSDEQFNAGISKLQDLKVNTYLIFSPGQSLLQRFHRVLGANELVKIYSLKQNVDAFLETIIELLRDGLHIDWERVYSMDDSGIQKRRRLSLPGYVFDRKSYTLAFNQINKTQVNHGYAGKEDSMERKIEREMIEKSLSQILDEIYPGDGFELKSSIQSLDLDSVEVMQFVARIKREFGVEIPLKIFFTDQTVKDVFQIIETQICHNSSLISEIERQANRPFFPVSSAQKRQFVLNQLDLHSLVYNLPGVYVFKQKLDYERCADAFKTLIQRHESLRTSFEIVDGQPVQIIHQNVDFQIYYEEVQEDVQKIIKRFIRPFTLSIAPLFRVGIIKYADKHLLMYDMHHIISDGTSVGILFSEFVDLYEGNKLPDLRIQYRDVAVWQNALFNSEAFVETEKYWLNKFSEEIPILNLPTDHPRPAILSYEGDSINLKIKKEEIHQLCNREGTTLYMFLLAAYNVLLHKYTGQTDIIVGSPITGRSHADMQNIIGMFVNTLAMRSKPASDKTFVDFLEEVKDDSLSAFENQDYQFEVLVNKLDLERDLSRNPLFDTMFVLQNLSKMQLSPTELAVEPYKFANKLSKFDLTLTAIEGLEEIYLNLEYSTKLFTTETITRFGKHLLNIIEKIIANPWQKIGDIELISLTEKEKIIYKFNQTKVSYHKTQTINECFETQVSKTPDQVAAIFERQYLTYGELNQKSNQLARLLRAHGVGAESIVGIMVERSLEMIIGIMGILKAGGAYLPIDPTYPKERINYMLADSSTQILLIKDHLADRLHFAGQMIDLSNSMDRLSAEDSSNLARVNTATNMVYVMYTSGSTGKPKGVVIEHRSLINHLNWMQKVFPFDGNDVFMQKTPFTFDVSVQEMFYWILQGAKVCFLSPGGEKDPEQIIRNIEENQVTTVPFVPSMLTIFLKHLEKGVDLERLSSLKRVISNGEALQYQHLKNFTKYLSQPLGTKLFNLYGPTEATIAVTHYECSLCSSQKVIPIGKPIDNSQIFILNQDDHLQPIGVPGELCIAGDGLARGYLNKPQLTAEKFVPNPFSNLPNNEHLSRRIYRTGDLACWLPDGKIKFIGRIDHQVKIRGHRIELAEIEIKLLEHLAIKEAIVTVRNDQASSQYLCGYFVSEKDLSVAELRDHLAQSLPDYMIPAYFVHLGQMPLTSNGKINRKALPAPDGSVKTGVEYVAPQNEVEERLVKLLTDLLEIKQIGVHDKFFEIGGDSIKIVILTSKVNSEFQANLKVQDLFKYNTISKLAKVFTNHHESQQSKKVKYSYS